MKKKNGIIQFVFTSIGIITLILFLSLGMMCEETNQDDSPIIARVGKALLTLNDLNRNIPDEYSDKITRKQRINYVKQWIDTEILYQEALRKKINEEKGVVKRIKEQGKKILGSEIIRRNVASQKAEKISEEEILNYYEKHKESFIREFDIVKYNEIVVEDLKAGWSVRNMITPINFQEIGEQYSIFPVTDQSTAPYIPIHTIPEEIASVVTSLRIEGTSSPIKMTDGVHIVRIVDKQPSGDVCFLEEVRDEIISTLTTQLQKQFLDDLLSQLRKGADYEFKFQLITGDKEVQNTNDSITNSSDSHQRESDSIPSQSPENEKDDES